MSQIYYSIQINWSQIEALTLLFCLSVDIIYFISDTIYSSNNIIHFTDNSFIKSEFNVEFEFRECLTCQTHKLEKIWFELVQIISLWLVYIKIISFYWF